MATFRSTIGRGFDMTYSVFNAGITVVETGTAFIEEAAEASKDAVVDLIHAGRKYAEGFRKEAEAANSVKVLEERAKVAEEEALAELSFRREALKKRKAELGITDETKPEKQENPVNVSNVGQELKGEANNG